MAKIYLEIIEELTLEELLIKQPQIIRIEVKDKNEGLSKVKDFKDYFINKNYKQQIHYCKHEEGKACIKESIEK